MSLNKKKYFLLIAASLYISASFAQNKMLTNYRYDSLKRKKYTLVFINEDKHFDTAEMNRMVDVFFTVYPKEAKAFNRKTNKKVYFLIDTSYHGVAATWADTVHFDPAWLIKKPEDIDVVTHEVMHIVQNYPDSTGPGWITEGIADYARYKFGVNNDAAGWKLTPYSSKQNYGNAYRVTARFFVWIEQTKHVKLVKRLDKAMRYLQYTPYLFKKITGETVDELWLDYSKNPTIDTTKK